MEISDCIMWCNKDWDLSYLSDIFTQDFYDFQDLWQSNVSDGQLVNDVTNFEKVLSCSRGYKHGR